MKIRLLCLALVANLCAVCFVSCGKSGAARTPGRDQEAPRPVQVARVALRPMARMIVVTGTLGAQEQSTLSAKVPGRLQLVAVDIGSMVRPGDLLAQVEPRDYELSLQQSAAALAQARAVLGLPAEGEDDRVEPEQVNAVKQAQAVLEEAAKNRQRVKDLSQSGIASQSEMDTVEAAHTVALMRYATAREEARTRLAAVAQRRAEYEIARKQLADASVRAPFDGVIQARLASIGEYVAAGAPIVQLVKTDPLRLKLQVPERESLLVRTGQVVRVSIEGDTNTYAGRIARLSPALDEQSRMLLVEADVPAQGPLRPGLYARAQIVVREGEPALSVPTSALTAFAGLQKVVVVQDGRALEKVVTVGRQGMDWIEIVSGLALGEEVVLHPAGLRTGQPLAPADSAQSQTAVRTNKNSGT